MCARAPVTCPGPITKDSRTQPFGANGRTSEQFTTGNRHRDSTRGRREMAPDFPQVSVQQIGTERRRFLEIARQVSESIGTEFFSMLVRELRRGLGADCVYVCEFVGRQADRARTLAACGIGDRMETFEFPMEGSPDAEV